MFKTLCFVIGLSTMVGSLVILQSRAEGLSKKFDPKRDAAEDIDYAIAEAKRSGKHILLDVGGEWCVWCHRMDEFFVSQPKLLAYRKKNYIWLKINFSSENENQEVLGRYPKIAGYPHLFVLDSDGSLLHSQNTGLLEQGKGYDLQKFTDFLETWAPKLKSRKQSDR